MLYLLLHDTYFFLTHIQISFIDKNGLDNHHVLIQNYCTGTITINLKDIAENILPTGRLPAFFQDRLLPPFFI